MKTDQPQTGAYLSDDAETRMRLAAAPLCRWCSHLNIRGSFILDDTIKLCEAAGENEVLGRILLRLAESGRCDEATPLFDVEPEEPPSQPISASASACVAHTPAALERAETARASEDDTQSLPPTRLSAAIDLFVSGLLRGAQR